MTEMLPRRADAVTMIGLTLLALAAFALVSHFAGLPALLTTRFCGAVPALSPTSVRQVIDFSNCQSAIEGRYWTATSGLLGLAVGYSVRSWLRWDAKRDLERDRQLDEEIARSRGNAK
jgi:hypothetical protein